MSWPLLFKRLIDNVWRCALGEVVSARVLKATTTHLVEISNAARGAGVRLPPDAIVARSLNPIMEECARHSREDIGDIVATAFALAG